MQDMRPSQELNNAYILVPCKKYELPCTYGVLLGKDATRNALRDINYHTIISEMFPMEISDLPLANQDHDSLSFAVEDAMPLFQFHRNMKS